MDNKTEKEADVGLRADTIMLATGFGAGVIGTFAGSTSAAVFGGALVIAALIDCNLARIARALESRTAPLVADPVSVVSKERTEP